MPRGDDEKELGVSLGNAYQKKNRIPFVTDEATRAKLRELSPLDVMTKTMNAHIEAAKILGEGIVQVDHKIITQLELLRQACAIAKEIAPYMHSKRPASMEVTGADGEPIQHHITAEIVTGGAVTNE